MSINIQRDGDNYNVYNFSRTISRDDLEDQLQQLQFELNVINWIENNVPQPARILEYLEAFQGLTSVIGILEKKDRLEKQIAAIEEVLL